MVECEAKSVRSVPENAPPLLPAAHAHSQPLSFYSTQKKKEKEKRHHGLCATYSNT